MQLKRVSLTCLALFTVACSHVGVAELSEVDSVNNSNKGEGSPEILQQEVVAPTSIEPALLFNLLGGEIAGQRGSVGIASELYMRAARQSQDAQVALRAAQVALYNQDFSSAKVAVDILLQSENIDKESRQLALIVYLRAGAVNDSVEQINHLLALEKSSERGVLLAVGDVITRNANKTVGLEVINIILKNNPSSAGAFLIRSQHWLSVSRFDLALEDVNKAIELEPQWELSYLQRSKVLGEKGDEEGASKVLAAAAERFNTVSMRMEYAKLLLKQERLVMAKEQLLAVLAIDERASKTQLSLALVHLKLNEIAEAEVLLNDLYANKIFPDRAAYYLGRINYLRKDFKPAIEWFERVGRGPIYIEAQSNISNIRYKSGDLSGAIDIIRKLRTTSPTESARFYLLEADLLMSDGNYVALAELMAEAVEKEPENLRLRYTRAIAATEVDDDALAEADLLYVLAKEPSNVNALNALGYLLASKTFRFSDARKYLKQALVLRPNDAAILDSMGWLEYREGRYEEAFALLAKAYKKVPEGEIAAHLGEVMWMLGRQKEARKLWENALRQSPDDKYLLEVFERLK